MREASTASGWRRSIMGSRRERKKSSVVGQANSTAELPENSPCWKSNWAFGTSDISPKTLCSCKFREFFRDDQVAKSWKAHRDLTDAQAQCTLIAGLALWIPDLWSKQRQAA